LDDIGYLIPNTPLLVINPADLVVAFNRFKYLVGTLVLDAPEALPAQVGNGWGRGKASQLHPALIAFDVEHWKLPLVNRADKVERKGGSLTSSTTIR
jgi:hypothetical protein